MKRLWWWCVGAALMASVVNAGAVEYRALKPEASRLAFAYTQMGVGMEGQFRKFSAQLVFDPAQAATAKAQFEVDLASIDTGTTDVDQEVLGKAWFNTKEHPTAKFVSSRIKALGANRYEVTGKLTIKGRTRDVTAPFTFAAQGNTGVFDGAFTLKRLDYAIGEGAWADVSAVADEIQIKVHLVALSSSAAPAASPATPATSKK